LLTPTSAKHYYLQNQYDRGIRFGSSAFQAAFSKLFGKKWIHSNNVLGDCLVGTVTDNYLAKKISEWPENVHFWTFDESSKEFVNLSKSCRFPSFPSGSLIRATAAIPGLFEPYSYENAQFSDAILAPGIKDVVKSIRSQSKNLLFVHMHKETTTDNAIYVKPHSDRFGYRRLIWDYIVYVSGMENLEFWEAFKHGLFEIEPISHDA
jgi:hypothetical protein